MRLNATERHRKKSSKRVKGFLTIENMGVHSLSDRYCLEGMELVKQRSFEEAEAKFKLALSYKHDHSYTVLQYGLFLQNHKRDCDGAVRLWKHAAESMVKNKHHVQMLCNLSVVLSKVNHDDNTPHKHETLGLKRLNEQVDTESRFGVAHTHLLRSCH